MDTGLIVGGKVVQVWRDTAAATLPAPGAGTLVEFNPGAVVCGMAWDGTALSIPTPVLTKPQLVSYANIKQAAVMGGGITISGVPVSTTLEGKLDMAGAVTLAQLVPDHVFDWVTDAGPVSLTAAQVIAIGEAVGLFVQATYTTLGTVITGIIAGTITTTDQIDAAEWPSNS